MAKLAAKLTMEITDTLSRQMRNLMDASGAMAAAENLEDELRVHGVDAHASAHLVEEEQVAVVVFSLDAPEAVMAALDKAGVNYAINDISKLIDDYATALINVEYVGHQVQIYVTHKREPKVARQVMMDEPVSLYREPEAA